jgi:hypothetical protein
MLSLKLGLSLNTTKPYGEWTPAGSSKLIAWYKHKTGITLNGSDVSAWADSSTNSFDMVQATATEQPAYDASTGVLTFVSADTNNLQTTGQISLDDSFLIGMRIKMTTAGGVPLADNTTAGEFIKYTTSSQMRIKIDNSQVDISLNGGTTFGDNFLVISRDASDKITLYVDGVAQTDTETLAGTADIDSIGVRRIDLNPFNGQIKEIQIYKDIQDQATLIANVNDYLSNL